MTIPDRFGIATIHRLREWHDAEEPIVLSVRIFPNRDFQVAHETSEIPMPLPGATPDVGGAPETRPDGSGDPIMGSLERLTAAETARILGIEAAVANRDVSGLKRLKEILATMPDGQEGL